VISKIKLFFCISFCCAWVLLLLLLLPFDFCARLQKMAAFFLFLFFFILWVFFSVSFSATFFMGKTRKTLGGAGKARNGQLQGLIVYENALRKSFSVQSSRAHFSYLRSMHKVSNFSSPTKIDGVCRAQSKIFFKYKQEKKRRNDKISVESKWFFCALQTL